MTFVNEGTFDGETFVTVLNATGDPIEYEIPLKVARATYGDHPVVDNVEDR